LGGIDFGSSTVTPTTIGSVILHWRKSKRYQLAGLRKFPQGDHPFDKARDIALWFSSYGIDIGVGDIGHAQDMIPIIQTGGRDSNDVPFPGLSKRVFHSCRTYGDETKPMQDFKQETDEKGTEMGRFEVDKTSIIQQFIDFIGWKVPVADIRQPWLEMPNAGGTVLPKFMIPFKEPWAVDWILKELCSITRKDLEKDPDTAVEDPRQKTPKLFNHPPDVAMSFIYNLVGDNNYDEDAYRVLGTSRRRK
jgi:hypothetical protein